MSVKLKDNYTRDEVNQANIEYHNALAERYDEREALFHPRLNQMYKDILNDFILPGLPQDNKVSVLDVACGTGLMENFFDATRFDVTAFDISPKMIEVAQSNFPNAKFLVGDAYNMPLGDGELFDIVAENGALHHIKDYYDVINAMAARVRPGGKLYLGCEPNRLGFQTFSWCRSFYRKLAPEKRIEEATGEQDSELEMVSEYHQFFAKGMSPGDIKKFLKERGFTDIKVLYRAEHFIAQLHDSMGLNIISWIPNWMLRLHGPFALNFHIVATKASGKN